MTIGWWRTAFLDADKALARTIVGHQHAVTRAALPRLSNAANHSKLWLVVAAGSAAFGGRRGRRAAQRGLLSIAASSVIASGILKPLLPRVRPPVDPLALPSIVRRPISSSFPSGHSASAAAFATAVAMEAPALAAPVAALATAVAYSRVSTGVHYPSDVIAGSLIGAAVATASTRLWPMVNPDPAKARTVPRWIQGDVSSCGAGLTVVVNSAAGSAEHDAEVHLITDALPDARIIRIDESTQLETTLRESANSATALGVLGGDGTIGAAAASAIESGIPLLIFPGGTLNHFARDLGVDRVADAISAFREGNLVEVDVGCIDGRMFLNTASFGSYSEFVDARESYENRWGKWPAVAVALTKVLVSGEPLDVHIDGVKRKIWMIFVGNCAYDPPGFAPASRDRLDDGALDVRIVDGTEPRARLRLIVGLLTGRLSQTGIYQRRLAERIDIVVPNAVDAVSLAADGEIFAGNAEFSITKLPTRLLTYAPRS